MSSFDRRIEAACKFDDERYYKQYHRYFDVLAQVHSVVETINGAQMLRVWRGRKFGPGASAERRERRLFHVTQDSFKRYIVPPNPRIGKAIEENGKELLIEIDVYDDHRDGLKNLNVTLLIYFLFWKIVLQSGDFVAIQNVHAASTRQTEMQVLHGGGASYQRGITTVPVDFEHEAFQNFKKKVEAVLETVAYDENFTEFQQPEEVAENHVDEE